MKLTVCFAFAALALTGCSAMAGRNLEMARQGQIRCEAEEAKPDPSMWTIARFCPATEIPKDCVSDQAAAKTERCLTFSKMATIGSMVAPLPAAMAGASGGMAAVPLSHF